MTPDTVPEAPARPSLRRFFGCLSAELNALIALLLLLLLMLAAPAAAAPREEVRLDEVGRGELLFRDTDGALLPAPLVDAAYDVEVNGLAASTRLVQTFRNPHADWMEAVYVFPLPEAAAVHAMRLRVGDRVIAAEVQEKQQARRTYDAARADGRRAGLIEQTRPNLFSTRIANLPPGDSVRVELAYRETLDYRRGADGGGGFALRLPLVVAPRYVPLDHVVVASERGWALDPAAVEDAAMLNPPVLPPEATPPGAVHNPVTITVALDAGVRLAGIDSRHHAVEVVRDGAHRARVSLRDAAVPADRDFVLEWALDPGDAPAAGLFSEVRDGRRYVLAMVVPPAGDRGAGRPVPRDLVFVLDASGSMHGDSLSQAKAALRAALARLSGDDRFELVTFNDASAQLFGALAPATPETIARADRALARLDAEGGTEMAPALDRAFDALDRRADTGRLAQILFITDGAVGNEVELFARIRDRIGAARLFTVGIGSAPNGYFMRKTAQHGRGSFTFVDDAAQVADQLSALLTRLEAPALTDIAARWPDGVAADVAPDPLPDLYPGEPVVLRAALPEALPDGAVLTLTGRSGMQPWRVALPLDGARPAAGIAALWARGEVADWMDRLVEGADAATVRGAVLELGIAHSLVTRYTSLVAVDRSPARPADAPLARGAVPNNLPNGWSYRHVFGPHAPVERTQGPDSLRHDGTGPYRDARRGAASPAMAVALDVPAAARHVGVPQGATTAAQKLLVGALAAAVGLGLLVLAARRRRAERGA